MLRVFEDIPNTGDFYEFARVHYAYSVGKLGHETHVVPYQNHGCTQILLSQSQGAHHLALHNNVQGTRRLISDDNFGTQAYARGYCNSLLHTSTEFMGIHARNFSSQAYPL